jgi:Fur family ferric uptake transcriptional regulator
MSRCSAGADYRVKGQLSSMPGEAQEVRVIRCAGTDALRSQQGSTGRLPVTVSPDRLPVVVADLDEAMDAVRRRGLRLTSARRLVLEALLAARAPISAEDIADGLGGRMTQSDIASVYRNLETLGELGLVRHFHAGHGPGRYVLEGFGDREYLACESCGALESVEPAALDGVRDAVRELSGFEARFSHFPIVGLCARCAKKRQGKAGRKSAA